MSTTRSPLRWFAAVLLLVAAAAHVPLIRAHLEEAPYIGVGFIVLSVVCVVLAPVIVLVDTDGVWLAAGAICLGALMTFLASRTIGLPEIGDDIGNWTEPLGYPAVASELLMVVLVAIHVTHRRDPSVTAAGTS